jgi:hypothetical protein
MSKTFCDDEDLRDTDLSEEVKSSSAAPLDATAASFGDSASDPSSPMIAAARAPRCRYHSRFTFEGTFYEEQSKETGSGGRKKTGDAPRISMAEVTV